MKNKSTLTPYFAALIAFSFCVLSIEGILVFQALTVYHEDYSTREADTLSLIRFFLFLSGMYVASVLPLGVFLMTTSFSSYKIEGARNNNSISSLISSSVIVTAVFFLWIGYASPFFARSFNSILWNFRMAPLHGKVVDLHQDFSNMPNTSSFSDLHSLSDSTEYKEKLLKDKIVNVLNKSANERQIAELLNDSSINIAKLGIPKTAFHSQIRGSDSVYSSEDIKIAAYQAIFKMNSLTAEKKLYNDILLKMCGTTLFVFILFYCGVFLGWLIRKRKSKLLFLCISFIVAAPVLLSLDTFGNYFSQKGTLSVIEVESFKIFLIAGTTLFLLILNQKNRAVSNLS